MKRVEINEIQFKRLIDGVKHCVEKSDYRPMLQYIQIKVKSDSITAYALDGYRAARIKKFQTGINGFSAMKTEAEHTRLFVGSLRTG